MGQSSVERLLARDRAIVVVSLALCVILSSWYIVDGAGTGMSSVQMSLETGPAGALIAGTDDMVSPHVWSARYAVIVFLMWWLMMVAMMVPSAAPTILLNGALYRDRGAPGQLEFAAGYLVIWAVFSLAATAVQGLLAAGGMMSAMYMNFANNYLAATALIGAGLYQLSPVKAACLDHCRGPVEALTRHRRTGRLAAFRMGMVHGRYCLGCCWALMALLFVGGVMNIWWIVSVTLYVAAEKLAPGGKRVAQVMSVILIACGVALLIRSFGLFS
jgi:predicted metal-binding membrane protein